MLTIFKENDYYNRLSVIFLVRVFNVEALELFKTKKVISDKIQQLHTLNKNERMIKMLTSSNDFQF